MRATSLNFRSPKEATGGYYDPQVTYDGRRAKFPSIKTAKSNFSKERRFLLYLINEKRTNVVLGPTTYDPLPNLLSITKKPCLTLYVTLKENVETKFLYESKIRGLYNDR